MAVGRRWGAWLAFAVVLAALAIDVLHRHDRIGIDFHTYLAAARVGLHSGWPHIYDQSMVAAEQRRIDASMWAQAFLSPPTVAWLAAAFSWLAFPAAYTAWATFTLAALAASLAWAGLSRGVARWAAVAAALAPWWVMHAVNLGQVVPLVAAGLVVAWRLLRDRHDVAAGLVLCLVLLKPNTAILVPLALVFAGRPRAVIAWLAGTASVVAVAALTLGPHGLAAYGAQLTGSLPGGADSLTLHGALGVTGASAIVIRVALVGVVMATAYRLRSGPALLVPLAITCSLLVSPYLHASDLCLLAVAGWMVWEERREAAWKVGLAAAWLLASPFLYVQGLAPGLTRWPLLELLFLGALVFTAWQPLTGWADSRTRAPA